jgi:hypothetical protein
MSLEKQLDGKRGRKHTLLRLASSGAAVSLAMDALIISRFCIEAEF